MKSTKNPLNVRLTHLYLRPASTPTCRPRAAPARGSGSANYLRSDKRWRRKNKRPQSRLRQTTQIQVRWSPLTWGSLSDWGGLFKPLSLPDYSEFLPPCMCPSGFSHIKFYGLSIHLWTLFLSCVSFPVKSVWQHIYFSDQNRSMFFFTRARINSDGNILQLMNEWRLYFKHMSKKKRYKEVTKRTNENTYLTMGMLTVSRLNSVNRN